MKIADCRQNLMSTYIRKCVRLVKYCRDGKHFVMYRMIFRSLNASRHEMCGGAIPINYVVRR